MGNAESQAEAKGGKEEGGKEERRQETGDGRREGRQDYRTTDYGTAGALELIGITRNGRDWSRLDRIRSRNAEWGGGEEGRRKIFYL